MSQLDELSDEFDPKVMRRGQEYFRAGLVKLVRRAPELFETRVSGSGEYVVRITADDGEVANYSCTCPYGSDWGGGCKHVWASLLMAEARNWEGLGEVDGAASDRWAGAPPFRQAPPAKAKVPAWKAEFRRLRERRESPYGTWSGEAPSAAVSWPAAREVAYVIDVPQTLARQRELVVEVLTREPRKNGTMGKWKRTRYSAWEWTAAPEEDRVVQQMLTGCGSVYGSYDASGIYTLGGWAYETVLKRVCQTGRCRLRRAEGEEPGEPIAWDDAPAWRFVVDVRREGSGYAVTGSLRRDGADLPLSDPELVLRTGLMVARGRVARMDTAGAFDLMTVLRERGALKVAKAAVGEMVRELYALPGVPPVAWPHELGITEVTAIPVPTLKMHAPHGVHHDDSLRGELGFEYDGVRVEPEKAGGAVVVDEGGTRVIRRDFAAEARAEARLQQVGFRREWSYGGRHERRVHRNQFHAAITTLAREGWHVEADGKLYRAAGAIEVGVSSGVDWFDLTVKVDFGGTGAPLPRLLAAIEKGEQTVVLDDGTVGVVPEAWLRKYAPLAALGRAEGETMRFSRAQAGFLDALVATMPEARVDETFARARKQLAAFDGIKPAAPPASFGGELRPYQREGLGWLHFLNGFGFGGCLADDMGLGKTVEVLALLESRRAGGHGPSLVVVPRSLVFNWKQEAARFTPAMRVLDHSSPQRTRDPAAFENVDLVLTTYGTLRRDVAHLKDVEFDYAILDESQAIKNATTQSAKAARLLRARHRLAMSGTPIENRLAELWSLFEFLNPGMLGSAAAFRGLAAPAPGKAAEDAAVRPMLAKALRPFILRRTKQQVAKDLPDKVEQTIYCELDKPQRELYDELREHYRQSLLGTIEKVGIKRAKIQILEALLRLRQAACHPGLIDKKRAKEGSAKLDSLRANLAEVVAEDHKVLVFSQFTSFLSLVKADLDAAGTTYEYLDGKTRDRDARVRRFQEDPACKVFLISLKAGGVGLNLTAADYVFLLDPWWNPAVEAQAIDRTHRIGQQRAVFAYRLIAKDTVEEKVLELQRAKRELADAILTQDNSVIAGMCREDLELLLG